MAENAKILIVDDEEDVRAVERLALRVAGFSEFEEAADGSEAIAKAVGAKPALIVLDMMMPGIDGLEVLKALKADAATAKIPVVVVSARGSEDDIVTGLEQGAADYVTKPFSGRILAARVKAALRMANPEGAAAEAHGEKLECDGLELDLAAHTAHLDGEEIVFTRGEFAMLQVLARHPRRVYTRAMIIAQVRGDDYTATERSVDTAMVSVRRKLGAWGEKITTVRGVGYRLESGRRG